MVSSSSTQETQSVSAEMLERYVNDSLHAWFRQEFLMEYQAEAGRLVCMVCSCPLPSLHLDHIKRHVLGQHPNSLVYSAEEKHRVLQSWAESQGERPPGTFGQESVEKPQEVKYLDWKWRMHWSGEETEKGTWKNRCLRKRLFSEKSTSLDFYDFSSLKHEMI